MRAARTILLASLLASLCAACLAHRQGWGRGSYRRLYESDTLQIRSDLGSWDPLRREVLVGWVGARAKPGGPALSELRVVFFLDRDGDLVPARGEILGSWSSVGASQKLMLSHLVAAGGPPEALSGEVAAWTADGDLVVRTWRLLEPD